MTDQLERTDPLLEVVRNLQLPVPMMPGLPARMAARRRRRQRWRQTRGAAAMLMLLVLVTVIMRRTPSTAVHFALTAPSVQSVSLVGDFTDWRTDQLALRRTAAGQWQATVKLRPGRYRYAYLVDHQQWRADTREAMAPDDFGRPTSVVTVTGN